MSADEERARAAIIAARAAYGRLLAWLARQWRDLAAAEDALGDAFATALEHWPHHGVPISPEGWLMTTAKRNLLKVARRQRLASDPALLAMFEETHATPATEFPDDRLRLLFVCAHPAIDRATHCALMLQTVLGVEAARMAPVFLVSSEAMTKRLVRAKAKIKAAGIGFEEPGPDELPHRMQAVLEAIYGAYLLRESADPDDRSGSALWEEALYLAGLVSEFMPDCAEALGLYALLLLCEARRPARLDERGVFISLDRQNVRRWDRAAIEQAGALLTRAANLRDAGPFQIEAAIQAAHCHAIYGRPTPWADIAVLYERLIAFSPTIGARLGQAIAVAHARVDPSAGLALVDAMATRQLQAHQPWWAVRGYLLALAGRNAEALEAYEKARDMCVEEAVRRSIEDRVEMLRGAVNIFRAAE